MPAPDFGTRDEEELANGCGTERWLIKTASDADARAINVAPAPASISALTSLPSKIGTDSERISPTELTVYQLADVVLVQYRRESDGDYHLVLSDGTRTMIAEIPDPACVSPASPLLAAISRTRAQFEARHGPVSPGATADGETITVTGVGFFDFAHSQTGMAPNAIELHPLLSTCFGAGCAGAATVAPPQTPRQGCSSFGDATALLVVPFLRRRRAPPPRAHASSRDAPAARRT